MHEKPNFDKIIRIHVLSWSLQLLNEKKKTQRKTRESAFEMNLDNAQRKHSSFFFFRRGIKKKKRAFPPVGLQEWVKKKKEQ